MSDLENKLKEVEQELALSKEHLEKMMIEQQDAARLLIRRDLALSRANEKLQALDVAKSEFISIAAHQLRTPLSAIKWILHMISNNEFRDDAEKVQFVEKAVQSTDRMIALVNDLLEVDHIQSGKDQFVFTTVDVVAVVNSVVSEIQSLVEKRGVKLNLNLSPEIHISGDVNKLRAVFQNLIENAIKYTQPGGTVTVSSLLEKETAKFVVTDSGIGIPDNQKPHIFTKFFRAANALRVDTVGSGLGLFIAREIVLRHGGKIWFESEVGKGTSFFVELPIAPVQK